MQEQELKFDYETDVVVIGAGNAAMCAAISAREQAARVMVLEKSPEAEKGGNTTYTHGSIRFAYSGADEIRDLVPDLDDAEMAMTDFGSYTEEQFYDDMCRMTDYKTDPVLASILTDESYETMKWMTRHNVKWIPIYGRQAFKVDGVFKFWGGMVLESVGGGHGLVEALHEEASGMGVSILYKTMAVSLLRNDDGVYGVVIRENGKTKRIAASSVIIASGGFHANTEMRSKYLGTQWDAVHVRGSRYNTGDGIKMALEIGALPEGNWTLSHAVMGDRYLPDFEEGFQRLSYPFGILMNAYGERFLDEGADFRNYTYAKYGRELLKQPGGYGYQVFDAQTSAQLREEYKGRKVTKVRANTLEELADKMDVDKDRFLAEVKRFNESVDRTIPFNPNVKDGRRTIGLSVPKSNWANPIEEGPFEAYAVTCGITFTFGGLKINEEAEVQDTMYESIQGLYAAGEAAGGLFYSNYPGGAGLMAGSVFGKIAGAHAAEHANQRAGAKAATT